MNMDLGLMLYNSLKDVTWSTTTLALDRLVSAHKLPQIVRLDGGEAVEGLRENDYLLIHSCRQWTTITAHSLEEGHYVIGPKIEIPVHYEGQFKLLEQDRDIKEPVQYFSSVEEVAKAFPERVYVMEEITFNVKVASGESNEDTEVYNVTLCTGDELTLMGQAEILYAKTSREKSRFNTIFKRIGKLNSISRLGRGKMPCLICMNHRTNESISLPFQCRGRFSTCSPLELQMQEGEHTIRTIVEKTRLPVNVLVPACPPRNPHDLHLIREGHRYKLVNIQTRTVVVCCALRSHAILPLHFPLHLPAALPRLLLPEGLLEGEAWLETMVHRWFAYCQEQFDCEVYSRAVRDVRSDWTEEGKSNGCPAQMPLPSALSSARDDLTRSFHRLSVCVYGNNLHGNSEVNLQGCASLCGDCVPAPEDDYLLPEPLESSCPLKPDLPYEELWLEHTEAPPFPSATPTLPPPVPPKSEAVKEECRLLNAPPIPPRSSKHQKPRSPSPTLSYYSSGLHSISAEADAQTEPEQKHPCHSCTWIRQDAADTPHHASSDPSPSCHASSDPSPSDPSPSCHASSDPSSCHTSSDPSPSRHATSDPSSSDASFSCLTLLDPSSSRQASLDPSPSHHASSDASFSRLSWPNDFCGTNTHKAEDFPSVPGRSYSSYPRKRTPATPRACPTVTLQVCTKSISYTVETERDTKQSQSCPILPPRSSRSSVMKKDSDPSTSDCSPDTTEASPSSWQPPHSLSGISIEEVSRSLHFIGLSDDVVSLFVREKIDGNLLLQLTEEILSEDFKLSKLQVKKLVQFINGWRPKM